MYTCFANSISLAKLFGKSDLTGKQPVDGALDLPCDRLRRSQRTDLREFRRADRSSNDVRSVPEKRRGYHGSAIA